MRPWVLPSWSATSVPKPEQSQAVPAGTESPSTTTDSVPVGCLAVALAPDEAVRDEAVSAGLVPAGVVALVAAGWVSMSGRGLAAPPSTPIASVSAANPLTAPRALRAMSTLLRPPPFGN